MAELKYWELSDESISKQLSRISKILGNASKVEDIERIQKIELGLLEEQRRRMATMLNDETDASKISLEEAKLELEKAKLSLEQSKDIFKQETEKMRLEIEKSRLNLEESKVRSTEDLEKMKIDVDKVKADDERFRFKINAFLKIVEVIVTALGSGAVIYSAKKGFDAKKLECESKERNVDRITRLEENGDIPYQQANKLHQL